MRQTNNGRLSTRPRSIGRRVIAMATTWAGLGMLLGASIGLRKGATAPSFAAFVIAGAVVCLAAGVCLGLFSACIRQTLVGGFSGIAILSFSGPLFPEQTSLEMAELGLICGALVGATILPWLTALIALARSAVSCSARSPKRQAA
jgi:hypothetical protein